MVLYELFEDEQHPEYRALASANLERQYGFLTSIVNAAVAVDRPMVSTAIVKALNYHAICCLHVNAGEYRPCPVEVGGFRPPAHYRVPELMNAFVNEVNRHLEAADALTLAAYCLWRLNHIHPFINGNGRTARALCYYVICVKFGGPLPGAPILPELIRRNREQYVELLRATDAVSGSAGEVWERALDDLRVFVLRLLNEQTAFVEPEPRS